MLFVMSLYVALDIVTYLHTHSITSTREILGYLIADKSLVSVQYKFTFVKFIDSAYIWPTVGNPPDGSTYLPDIWKVYSPEFLSWLNLTFCFYLIFGIYGIYPRSFSLTRCIVQNLQYLILLDSWPCLLEYKKNSNAQLSQLMQLNWQFVF